MAARLLSTNELIRVQNVRRGNLRFNLVRLEDCKVAPALVFLTGAAAGLLLKKGLRSRFYIRRLQSSHAPFS